MTYYKYPKTLHLPWSPGLQNDDRMMPLEDVTANFEGKHIVITEKLDGENTSMYTDKIHARSMDSVDHPSRSWVKGLHGRIAHLIPHNWRICGENVYAHHSIFYEDLPTYFFVFSIWNSENICLSLSETLEWCSLLGLHFVPILYEGPWNMDMVKKWDVPEGQEGYVVRNVNSYHFDDFQKNIVKWVRKDHVQTDQHWMSKPVVKNLLK